MHAVALGLAAGTCDEDQRCVCDLGFAGDTCSAKPRTLEFGDNLEGAVVDRNLTFFGIPSGDWRVGDRVVLALSQGEATLLGAIGFVPNEESFQVEFFFFLAFGFVFVVVVVVVVVIVSNYFFSKLLTQQQKKFKKSI